MSNQKKVINNVTDELNLIYFNQMLCKHFQKEREKKYANERVLFK
jgi:hypothetical protein